MNTRPVGRTGALHEGLQAPRVHLRSCGALTADTLPRDWWAAGAKHQRAGEAEQDFLPIAQGSYEQSRQHVLHGLKGQGWTLGGQLWGGGFSTRKTCHSCAESHCASQAGQPLPPGTP